ncbi:tetratricopeptide repeat protein [Nostoc sp.]
MTIWEIIHSKTEASPSASLQSQAGAINWFSKGIKKVNQQDYEGALLDFNRAIQIDSDYGEAYFQRGLIYAQGQPLDSDGIVLGCMSIGDSRIVCPFEVKNRIKENKQKAIKDFTQAIKFNPLYAAAYYQRGLVEESQQKKLQDFQQSINLYFQKSLVYLNQHDYKQTAELLETIDKVYAEIRSVETLSIRDNRQTEKNPINSSTISPERKKLDVLMGEACQALRKGDLKAAGQKYREAARILRERKDSRYQEVQQIITEIEQMANR